MRKIICALLPGATAVLFLAAASDRPAPPTVALWGITNLASRMPSQLTGGRVARGSLVRITGWRLGPPGTAAASKKPALRSLAGSSVEIRQGSHSFAARPVMVSEEEIHAVIPMDAPLGNCDLVVIHDGQESRPSPLYIVESGFGAFSENGHGWGPGAIRNLDGLQNTLSHPAHPGETVRLLGTGLGTSATSPEVLAGGKPGGVLGSRPVVASPGTDEIEFKLPEDAPEGCYVPVQVRTTGGISNSVTLSVSRRGEPCSSSSPAAANENLSGRSANISLIHLELRILLGDRSKADFRTDLGYADFHTRTPENDPNPIYLFPPPGSCTTYTGVIRAHDLFRPLETFRAGRSLDAGNIIQVTGPKGERTITRKNRTTPLYTAVLGGTTPLPMRETLPLFLQPGEYRIQVPGGAGLEPFDATMRMERALRWKNRNRLSTVHRAEGTAIEWKAAHSDDLIVITAMNAAGPGDAMAVCFCAVTASAGRFTIPPYVLANIPPTEPGQNNLPLNLLFVSEIHNTPIAKPAPGNLDALTLSSLSAVGRTVTFR